MYLTTEQLVEKYPAFTMTYLRSLLRERDKNGLADAVINLTHRRLLVDEERFLEWIEARRGTNG